jgi:hypothetical protein
MKMLIAGLVFGLSAVAGCRAETAENAGNDAQGLPEDMEAWKNTFKEEVTVQKGAPFVREDFSFVSSQDMTSGRRWNTSKFRDFFWSTLETDEVYRAKLVKITAQKIESAWNAIGYNKQFRLADVTKSGEPGYQSWTNLGLTTGKPFAVTAIDQLEDKTGKPKKTELVVLVSFLEGPYKSRQAWVPLYNVKRPPVN